MLWGGFLSLFFKGDGSFWIAQDSSKHLLTVRLQVCTTSVFTDEGSSQLPKRLV